jgi:pilus assembly protein CpaB
MSRKWIGILVAIALAAIGTWVLVRYVQGAENRALEGEEIVPVLVISAAVSAGTAAEDIDTNVRVELVPVKVQAPGSIASVEDLESLEGLVAAVDLIPGEQVIAARFIEPQVFEELDDIEIPEGLLEITVSLPPARVVGAVLRPGGHVAVFASFGPFSLESTDTGGESPPGEDADAGEAGEDAEASTAADAANASTRTPNTTHIILHKVLVTNVQVEELPQENTSEDASTATLELSPTGNSLITLAMSPENAERFVFTAEFGSIWLADEPLIVDETRTSIQDRSTVYDDPLAEVSP